MRTKLFLCLLAACLCLSTGCNSLRNDWKHAVSSTLGLSRTITLYDANGKIIRVWHTTSKVEDNGGSCYFIDDKGRVTTISGCFVVEET